MPGNENNEQGRIGGVLGWTGWNLLFPVPVGRRKVHTRLVYVGNDCKRLHEHPEDQLLKQKESRAELWEDEFVCGLG